MTLTIGQLLDQARQSHHAGDLVDAERRYRDILNVNPDWVGQQPR